MNRDENNLRGWKGENLMLANGRSYVLDCGIKRDDSWTLPACLEDIHFMYVAGMVPLDNHASIGWRRVRGLWRKGNTRRRSEIRITSPHSRMCLPQASASLQAIHTFLLSHSMLYTKKNDDACECCVLQFRAVLICYISG